MKPAHILTAIGLALAVQSSPAQAPAAPGVDRTVLPLKEPLRQTTIRFEFAYDGPGLGKGGTGTLFLNDKKVDEGKIAQTQAMKDRAGAFVIIDCASGETTDFDAKASAESLPPCSTFKIFVGFVESGERSFAFAATLQGAEASGAETRALVETILLDLGLLNR